LLQRSTAAELVAAGVVAVLFFSPLALRLLATGTSKPLVRDLWPTVATPSP
jgi:hypothetical protein